MSSLQAALEAYIETVSAGRYDIPRRNVADDLRALLAGIPAPELLPGPAPEPMSGLHPVPVDGLTASTAYAILSLRDGLEPMDDLAEADDHMRMFFRKPGRARIMHRSLYATGWAPLDPSAEGPALQAA
ncbi:MAG TPA: hypothetical protein VF867_18770 [Arthrobacter sp.]